MNKQVILKKRPVGFPDEHTWGLEAHPIPELQEGEILTQQHYISLYFSRSGHEGGGWLNDSKSYIPPVAIDDVMRAGSIFKVGDTLTGRGGVQQYVATHGDSWYKVDEDDSKVPNVAFY